MTKRVPIAILAAFLAFSLLFAACADVYVVVPLRGEWNNGVYTSDYLGLRFTLPEGWVAATDDEIAANMGLAADFIDDIGAGLEMPEDMDLLIDMMARSEETGANVQVIFERLPGRGRITEADYIEEVVRQMELLGGELNLDFPGTTTLGGYEFYAYGTEMTHFGVVAYGRQFINIQDGFVRLIIITYFEGSETVEEILEMFS